MYSFATSQTITADSDKLWRVWTDPDRFPDWDPRELYTKLNGLFAVGSTIVSKQKGNPGGTATICTIIEGERWAVTTPLPGGQLLIDHLISRAGNNKITVTKRYAVSGPLSVLFRLYYGRKVRRSMPGTFDALEREVTRCG